MRFLIYALALLPCAPAAAKVVFTGYGAFQFNPQGRFDVYGPPSVLSSFGLGPERIETRGATIDSLGLFATTSLSEATRLQMDVTYRDIGVNAQTVRIQYAYVEHSAWGGDARVGKITLPFGYYNQNRFYPFQRPSISGPFFQTSILGLPIADIGATAGRPFELGGLSLRADVYAVNGFGSLAGSSTTFRSANLPGRLTIANNIAARNVNHRIAAGGRVDLSRSAAPGSSVGASYYRDEWDPAGKNLFEMAGAHFHGSAAGFQLLAEYLYLHANGDEGLLPHFGSTQWRTDGFFAEADYDDLSVAGKKLVPWLRYEDYFSHGASAGPGREALWAAAGGAALYVLDSVMVKLELEDLYYRLPYQGLGDLKLKGYTILIGLVATF